MNHLFKVFLISNIIIGFTENRLDELQESYKKLKCRRKRKQRKVKSRKIKKNNKKITEMHKSISL